MIHYVTCYSSDRLHWGSALNAAATGGSTSDHIGSEDAGAAEKPMFQRQSDFISVDEMASILRDLTKDEPKEKYASSLLQTLACHGALRMVLQTHCEAERHLIS